MSLSSELASGQLAVTPRGLAPDFDAPVHRLMPAFALALSTACGRSGVGPTTLAPAPPANLFTEVDAPTEGDLTPARPAAFFRLRYVTVDFGALEKAKPVGSELRFNVFPDSTFDGVVENSRPPEFTNSWLLSGRIKGREFTLFTAIFYAPDARLLADVSVPVAGSLRGTYWVNPVGKGVHVVYEVDPSNSPPL